MSFTNRDHGKWIKIVRVDRYSWLGFHNGVLNVGDESGPKRPVDSSMPIGLLPLLERPAQEVLDEITSRERALSVRSGTFMSQIPLNRLLHAAVSTKMDYWIQLALDWVPDTRSVFAEHELLRLLSESTWATQRVKHKVRRILRDLDPEA